MVYLSQVLDIIRRENPNLAVRQLPFPPARIEAILGKNLELDAAVKG